ncbi:PucR family transcriptional regulator ligand-binding domain-containing protein [Streptomyces sp. JJ38]|uniref:PucR family transcriptional regulator n=1 Tax=Streptomyces sp. JJ38 TaxID=2738128 RepID=UPI001C58A1C2|nr:PucR family transcriptional regulator ligand-binding domain-containing protein [Streptomyces sp. JJ38]MBW1596117.1 LysR family transcriptional regulator [Streptomyces sp. JJ38]
MLPTVAEVLTLPELRQGDPQVVAAGQALGRTVRWVHSAELADIASLLRGGELVLTTGIALPADGPGLERYVRALSEVGAVGLVVELGRRWSSRLPRALVSACEHLGLPLVALRREVRFVTVTQAVAEQIVDAQVVELRAAGQIHDAFTALSIAEAGPADILAEAARISGCPVVLESFRHQVLGYATGGRPGPELLRDWERRSRRVRPAERTGYDQRAGWLVTVVGSRGDDWGRLVVLTPQAPPHRHLVLIERAATALALHRLHARHRDSVERQAHHVLLTALRDRRVDEELLSRCAEAGVPLAGRALSGLAARPVLQRERRTFVAADALTSLAAALASALRERGVPALVGTDPDDVIALVAAPAGTDLDALLTGVAADLGAPGEATLAVGETVHRPRDAGRSLAEAHHVAASLRPVDPARPFHRLADVHLRGLLHLLSDDDRLARFVQRELDPLLRHDAEHGTALLEVLRTLLVTGDKTAAAAALHVSRPVLYDRIARIERILGADLADPETRTSLHTALLAHGLGETDNAPAGPAG